uniref:Hematopoietic cell-specific Lyn substrate 1 n=1 Tax=Varanus komodoensis TaxID=61221 RepID=A0A8D2Q8E3_VARKO
MWKAAAGHSVSVKAEAQGDDWDTDPDFVNDISEKEQRWGAKTIEGSGRKEHIDIHQLRSKVSEEHEVLKKKEQEQAPRASYGYGGKFGTEKDRMDKSALGHEYVAEVGRHSSQTDAAKGFGGKYGVQKDRADKSALGWAHKEEVKPHESQTATSWLPGRRGSGGPRAGLCPPPASPVPSHTASGGAGNLRQRFEDMAKAAEGENQRRAEEERARRLAREQRERQEQQRQVSSPTSSPRPPPRPRGPAAAEERVATRGGGWPGGAPSESGGSGARVSTRKSPLPGRRDWGGHNSNREQALKGWRTRSARGACRRWPSMTTREVGHGLASGGASSFPCRPRSLLRGSERWRWRCFGCPPAWPPVCPAPPSRGAAAPGALAQGVVPPAPAHSHSLSAEGDDEISFFPGDTISSIELVDEGWWRGSCHGRFGLFPANYVELLP